MIYRQLGRTGLRVSVFSLGTWLTFAEQADPGAAAGLLAAARQAGVNLFDTAETYGHGAAELMLGNTIESSGWRRAEYVLSTKLFWGLGDAPHMQRTLTRKYLLHAVEGCLERLRTTHVDILYCHRFDDDTSVEEVVWTMSDIISAGKAHHWGTSEWPIARIQEAFDVAERYRLRKPAVEQAEYNLFRRARFEGGCAPLAQKTGLGLTVWSPLASGLLTEKYAKGGQWEGTRAAISGYEWLTRQLLNPEANAFVEEIGKVARSVGASAAQLSLAWCARHPAVSSVTLGARNAAQLLHNLDALKLTQTADPRVFQALASLLPPESAL